MNTESHLNAVWVTDSETGEQLLLDVVTGFVVARKDKAGVIIPE